MGDGGPGAEGSAVSPGSCRVSAGGGGSGLPAALPALGTLSVAAGGGEGARSIAPGAPGPAARGRCPQWLSIRCHSASQQQVTALLGTRPFRNEGES